VPPPADKILAFSDKTLRVGNRMSSPPARGGVHAEAGGVVGAMITQVTTPSASHPPHLEKEGSETGLVILFGALSVKSLWNDAEAARCRSELDLRVYTSRLLGQDASLVLHGGGNTPERFGASPK